MAFAVLPAPSTNTPHSRLNPPSLCPHHLPESFSSQKTTTTPPLAGPAPSSVPAEFLVSCLPSGRGALVGETEAVLVIVVSSAQDDTGPDHFLPSETICECDNLFSQQRAWPCGNSRVYQSHRSTIHAPPPAWGLGAKISPEGDTRKCGSAGRSSSTGLPGCLWSKDSNDPGGWS